MKNIDNFHERNFFVCLLSFIFHQNTFLANKYQLRYLRCNIYHDTTKHNTTKHNTVKHDMDPIEFTKKQYNSNVQNNRKMFVFDHFRNDLLQAFEKLFAESVEGKPCHVEAEFTPPEYFDINVAERILTEYFRDIGYNVMAEPRKGGNHPPKEKDDSNNKIVLTLT
jgi:hypothetical protein